ncbi:MAG TPA: hypothetical protein VK956_18780 [Verrucomicrobium sp.]|nr:hypothetical protein [Verrucomicrobium sp.]
MSNSPTKTTEKPPEPASNDTLELRAAEIAKRGGREEVSDEDRKAAFQEMKETAPPHEAGKEPAH